MRSTWKALNQRVTIDRENTTIVEGEGTNEAIQGQFNQLCRQIEETTSDYGRAELQERLAELAGGVAVINVGTATETEMEEKKAASRRPARDSCSGGRGDRPRRWHGADPRAEGARQLNA